MGLNVMIITRQPSDRQKSEHYNPKIAYTQIYIFQKQNRMQDKVREKEREEKAEKREGGGGG